MTKFADECPLFQPSIRRIRESREKIAAQKLWNDVLLLASRRDLCWLASLTEGKLGNTTADRLVFRSGVDALLKKEFFKPALRDAF